MRIRPNLLACLLYVCCALAILIFWYIYLFVGTPGRQTIAAHALSQFVFSFAESGAPWHFAALVLLPISFSVLAVAACRAWATPWRRMSWPTLLAAGSTLLVLLVMWEVVFFAGPALWLALQERDA
jgi:protein-S-isoprenylcysteine O-methyltransferase Ste14